MGLHGNYGSLPPKRKTSTGYKQNCNQHHQGHCDTCDLQFCVLCMQAMNLLGCLGLGVVSPRSWVTSAQSPLFSTWASTSPAHHEVLQSHSAEASVEQIRHWVGLCPNINRLMAMTVTHYGRSKLGTRIITR